MIIWSSVLMYSTLCLFKMKNTMIDEDLSSEQKATSISLYFDIAGLIIGLLSIYMIKRMKYPRSYLILYGLIISMNAMVVIQFIFDQSNPLTKIQFLCTLAFSFGCRLSSFFIVSGICLCSSLVLLNISLGSIQSQLGGIMMNQAW